MKPRKPYLEISVITQPHPHGISGSVPVRQTQLGSEKHWINAKGQEEDDERRDENIWASFLAQASAR